MTDTSALARHLPIADLVRVYRQAEADIREGFALLDGAEKRLDAIFKGDHCGISVRGAYGRTMNFEHDVATALENVKRDVWWRIVERLEIRRMLSIKAAKELDERLKNGKLPDITEESVANFAGFYLDHGPDMIAEAVREIRDWLCPQRGTYKTNDPVEVGRKIVLERIVEPAWHARGFRVDYHDQPKLTALCNVFSMLDGKGSISKTYKSPLTDAIESTPGGHGRTEYFEFRCFKKGTLHLTILRDDLRRKLNMIAGGKRLRPAEAA